MAFHRLHFETSYARAHERRRFTYITICRMRNDYGTRWSSRDAEITNDTWNKTNPNVQFVNRSVLILSKGMRAARLGFCVFDSPFVLIFALRCDKMRFVGVMKIYVI